MFNKKAVISSLTKIKSLTKILNNKNDVIIYSSENEIQFFYPKIEITNLFYNCGKTIIPFIEKETPFQIGVIYFTMDLLKLFIYKDFNIKEVFVKTFFVGNKTRRGGQSSQRFNRIYYNNKNSIAKEVNEIISKTLDQPYLILLTHKTLNSYIENDRICCTKNIENYTKNSTVYIINECIDDILIKYEKDIVNKYYEDFIKNPDKYVIGNEINNNYLKLLITTRDEFYNSKEIIKIKGITSEYCKLFKPIGGELGIKF